MNYAGTCKAGHSFQGRLEVPRGATQPKSFAERCPVPYCPHFITYKLSKEVKVEDFNAVLASDVYGLMDRLTTLARRLTGVPGYEPISRKKIVKELGEAQADIQAMRTAALQPE